MMNDSIFYFKDSLVEFNLKKNQRKSLYTGSCEIPELLKISENKLLLRDQRIFYLIQIESGVKKEIKLFESR